MRLRRWSLLVAGAALLIIATTIVQWRRHVVPPSIVLFVLDTTRFDAVSANGMVAGTTPSFDRLAGEGIRYTAAYAQSNWTVPSHATLFTGLYPHDHGVVDYRSRMPDRVLTVAERLKAAGYETVAVSENPWVSQGNALVRGFDHFTLILGAKPERHRGEVTDALGAWLAQRKDDRPFLLFVNVMDSHWPYRVREHNPFLPPDVDAAEAGALSQIPDDYLCRRDVPERSLATLRGLYLGGVAAADAKLGAVLAQIHGALPRQRLVTVVTADHGEHLGERGLFLHNYGIAEELIHVPLLVHGLPGAAPAVVHEPVELADVVPTLLALAGLPVPAELPGRPLPTRDPRSPWGRLAIAEYADLESHKDPIAVPPELERLVPHRAACRREDHVFGDMYALVRPPLKLVRNADGSTDLYDLTSRNGEGRDLAAEKPELVAELQRELAGRVRDLETADKAPSWTPDRELVERLHALGYAERPAPKAP